ncbi:MAG TPA: hypothetical protein VEC09_04735 [Actinomycetota bacterium]|nr:hypothetical protein [Actinomycetota bacterium]
MQAGAVLSEAWSMYRAHFRHFVAISLAFYVVLAAFAILLVLLLGPFGAIAAAFVGLAGVFWVQAALVTAVEDVRDGRADLGVRETIAGIRPHVNRLSFAAIGMLILLIIVAFLIALGFALFVIPGIALLIAFVIFLVRWSLLVPVLVLEDKTVFGALDRSQELVKGRTWPALKVIVGTLLVGLAAAIVVRLVLSPFPEWVESLGGFLTSALIAPFIAVAWTFMYYRLRPHPETALGAAPVAP